MDGVLTIPELFLEVLSHYLQDKEFPPERYYERLMTIARCCSRWYGMIRGTPYLWRYIIFDGNKIRKKFTYLAMRLVGRVHSLRMILVTSSGRKSHKDFLLDMVDMYGDRIEHINFICPFERNDNLTRTVLLTKSFPVLRSVEYTYRYHRRWRIWDQLFSRPKGEVSFGSIQGSSLSTYDMNEILSDDGIPYENPNVTTVTVTSIRRYDLLLNTVEQRIGMDKRNVTRLTLSYTDLSINLELLAGLRNLVDLTILDESGSFWAVYRSIGVEDKAALDSLRRLKVCHPIYPGSESCCYTINFVVCPNLEHLDIRADRGCVLEFLDSISLIHLTKVKIECAITDPVVDHVAHIDDVTLVCTSSKKMCKCKHLKSSHPHIKLIPCR